MAPDYDSSEWTNTNIRVRVTSGYEATGGTLDVIEYEIIKVYDAAPVQDTEIVEPEWWESPSWDCYLPELETAPPIIGYRARAPPNYLTKTLCLVYIIPMMRAIHTVLMELADVRRRLAEKDAYTLRHRLYMLEREFDYLTKAA